MKLLLIHDCVFNDYQYALVKSEDSWTSEDFISDRTAEAIIQVFNLPVIHKVIID